MILIFLPILGSFVAYLLKVNSVLSWLIGVLMLPGFILLHVLYQYIFTPEAAIEAIPLYYFGFHIVFLISAVGSAIGLLLGMSIKWVINYKPNR